MNLLLTGATGFIGGAVLRLARARGHRVAALVRPETLRGQGLTDDAENLVWLPGTLAEPPWGAIAAFGPEACVHAAWIATPGVYLESPENADWLRWSRAFVRQARMRAGVRRFLVLGTCIEYAAEPGRRKPWREDATPLGPTSFYARCKDELRVALEADAAREDFQLGWGRVFYPYGPGEHPARLCSALVRQLRAGERLVLKTPRSTKDYIFITDLAAAILALVEQGVPGAVNLGTGVGIPVREIAETVAGLLGRGPEFVRDGEPPAVVDPLDYVVADTERLRRATGWTPHVDLVQGLSQLVAGYLPPAATAG